jgi:hypothetical protein
VKSKTMQITLKCALFTKYAIRKTDKRNSAPTGIFSVNIFVIIDLTGCRVSIAISLAIPEMIFSFGL